MNENEKEAQEIPDELTRDTEPPAPAGPRNFGRYTYFGRLWGHPHVWSTTDPPNYGATISLGGDGALNEASPGENDSHPTVAEIEQARSMVREEAAELRLVFRVMLGKKP